MTVREKSLFRGNPDIVKFKQLLDRVRQDSFPITIQEVSTASGRADSEPEKPQSGIVRISMVDSDRNARLQTIFQTSEVPKVSEEHLRTFCNHLRENVEYPCFMFLAQDDGSMFESLELMEILEGLDPDQGIFVQVRRTSDHKTFAIPLIELECASNDPDNSRMIDDYCAWFARSMFRPFDL